MSLLLDDPGFLAKARDRLPDSGILSGRDRDFAYAVLDASSHDMTVVECRPTLKDAVGKMASPPAAVINGQFMGSLGRGAPPEGQVVRGGELVHADSRMKRWYIANVPGRGDHRAFALGEGDPWSRAREARAAFGGLGPVLSGGLPVPASTAWVRSSYAKPAPTGRGVIGIDRGRNLILLLVQENFSHPWTENARTLDEVRSWLEAWGVTDAVYNDGSDSEALFAEGAWLVSPGWGKDRAMTYAIGFVRRGENRRTGVLAIDGTRTPDAQQMVQGLRSASVLHYAPTFHASKVALRYGTLRRVVRSGVIEAWRSAAVKAGRATQAAVEDAGVRGAWAEILYVASHATRHGELYYNPFDNPGRGHRTFASPWSGRFDPRWRNTPLWVVFVGCAVLALRYTRLVDLTKSERRGLLERHRDIHGTHSGILGLSDDTEAAFEIYHPGWAWHSRVFQQSRIRGVLGYWYRSPGGDAGDTEIIRGFAERLDAGETLLSAWRQANQRGWTEVRAAWAAMVRRGAEEDTLGIVERVSTRPLSSEFLYYDDHVGSGLPMAAAFTAANRTTEVTEVGEVEIHHHEDYDRHALKADRRKLTARLTRKNFLHYSDGVGP